MDVFAAQCNRFQRITTMNNPTKLALLALVLGLSSMGSSTILLQAPTQARPREAESSQAEVGASPKAAKSSGKKQIFVLPLEGMVGVQLRAKEMQALREIADEQGAGQIIILKINSNGGLVLETEAIQEALLGIREKHRLVAWIEKAISGGAFTAFYAQEIYFMKTGSLGSITMISGSPPKWVEDKAQDWEDGVARTCEIGGYSPYLGRAMVHHEDLLSYDRDPDTGKVTFYPTLEGEFVLSDANENLCLNASNALACGFSKGTADTLDDLLAEMGLQKGQYELSQKGVELFKKWKQTAESAEEEVSKVTRQYRLGGTGTGDGIVVLRKRIDAIKRLIDLWKKAPELLKYELNMPSVEQLERELLSLQEQLKQAQDARKNAN